MSKARQVQKPNSYPDGDSKGSGGYFFMPTLFPNFDCFATLTLDRIRFLNNCDYSSQVQEPTHVYLEAYHEGVMRFKNSVVHWAIPMGSKGEPILGVRSA